MESRFLIIVLFLVAALANLNGLALFPFLPVIAGEFETSVSVIGQAITVTLLGGAVIGLVVGPLADHYGQRRFIVLGLLLMSISCAGTAIAGSYGMLLVVRFPAGLATGIMMGIGLSYATTRLDGDERRSAVGWIASGAALGAVVGPPLMTTLAELGSWRTGFWILAGAPVIVALCCLRVIPPDRLRPDALFQLRDTLSGYRDLLTDRRSASLQVGMLCWAVPVVAGSGYLGAYLIENHGFSLSGAGLGYMWAASWLMVGPRVGVWLLGYVQLSRLIVVAGVMMAVSIATVFGLSLGLPWILLAMMIWTLTMGAGNLSITSAISEAAQAGQSTAMMARQFSWTLGGAMGTALGGMLIASGGYALFGLVTGMFGIAVSVIVLGAFRLRHDAAPSAADATAG